MDMSENQDADVNVSEAGELKVLNEGYTPSVGTNDETKTVPAGKKWIIKAWQQSEGSLVATTTSASLRILNSDDDPIDLQTGSSVVYSGAPTQQFTLDAGMKVVFRTVLSAYTSGTIATRLLYQEIDA